MYYYFLLYFAVGVIQDILWTLNVRYVANDKPVLASLFSALTAMVSLTVFYNILTRLDSEKSLVAIIVYSLGIGFGTFIAMVSKSGIKKEKLKKIWGIWKIWQG